MASDMDAFQSLSHILTRTTTSRQLCFNNEPGEQWCL